MTEQQAQALYQALRILTAAGLSAQIKGDSLFAKIGRLEIDAPQGTALGCKVILDGRELQSNLKAVKVEGEAGDPWIITLTFSGFIK